MTTICSRGADRLIHLAYAVLFLLLLASVSHASDVRKLWESRDQFVALERSGTGIANDHPLELSPDRLTAILASIQVTTADNRSPQQLITNQSIEALVPHLVQGFRQAEPGDDVTFAIIGLYTSAMGLAKSPKVTTGRAFYKGGRLNVIFGFVQKDFNERADRRLYPFTPGSRLKTSEGEEWSLLPQPGQGGYSIVRKDWVTFGDDWRVAAVQAPVAEHRVPLPQAVPATVTPAQPAPVQIVPDQTSKPDNGKRSPAERLTTLNELKDKGLISIEEYRDKRREILNGL
jgi:hypothetical protein